MYYKGLFTAWHIIKISTCICTNRLKSKLDFQYTVTAGSRRNIACRTYVQKIVYNIGLLNLSRFSIVLLNQASRSIALPWGIFTHCLEQAKIQARKTNKLTARQTNKTKASKQTKNKHTKKTDKHTNKQTNKHTNKHTNNQAYKQTNKSRRAKNKHTNKQTSIQTNKQANYGMFKHFSYRKLI